LLRGVPRLHQIVVEADFVNAGDRRLGVGVGRQQNLAGLGKDLLGLGQKLDAGHLRHALVDQKQGDRGVALLKLLQDFEGFRAIAGTDDAVVAAKVSAQIAADGVQDLRLIVQRQDNGLYHTFSPVIGRGQGAGAVPGRAHATAAPRTSLAASERTHK